MASIQPHFFQKLLDLGSQARRGLLKHCVLRRTRLRNAWITQVNNFPHQARCGDRRGSTSNLGHTPVWLGQHASRGLRAQHSDMQACTKSCLPPCKTCLCITPTFFFLSHLFRANINQSSFPQGRDSLSPSQTLQQNPSYRIKSQPFAATGLS